MTGAARKLARHLPIAGTLCVKSLCGIAKDKVRGAKVRAISFAKTVLSWPGSDPAIQSILKNMRFLLLDGPIKLGHDISEFLAARTFAPLTTRH